MKKMLSTFKPALPARIGFAFLISAQGNPIAANPDFSNLPAELQAAGYTADVNCESTTQPHDISGAIEDGTAQQLNQRVFSGTVENQTISPVWMPDGSALYYRWNSRIVRIDTDTGDKSDAFDPQILTPYFEGKPPQVINFSVSGKGRLFCLAHAGQQIGTFQISGKTVVSIKPEDDPFALMPSRVDKNTRSERGSGATTIGFVNNTDQTVDIEWIDGSKGRKKYATLNPGDIHIQNTHAGHVFAAGKVAFCAVKEPAVAYLGSKPENAQQRELGRPWKAEFRAQNLFVKNNKTGKETQLTTDGSKDWKYCGPLYWAPDDRYLVVLREKAGTGRHIDLIKAVPDTDIQPETVSIPYLKPGDELDVKKPHLFDLATGKEIPLKDSLFSNPWNLSHYHWTPEGDRLFLIYNERGHQTLRLLAIQASTGKVATVVEETSPTFIDYSSKLYIHHLDKTDEAIWMSERSGWNHLYLIDRKTGTSQPITSGKWVVRAVDHVDPVNRQIWFRALGIRPGQDPYYVHHARINFDGSGLVVLTGGNGTHEVQFSNNRKFYTDTWSRADLPPIHELRRAADGKKITALGEADASKLLAIHPLLPEPFAAKGRDGKTDIHGVIYRPSHFDPQKQYPVIESIYAGPHDQFVPKEFKAFSNQQRLAERGFIVVRIDGMGTNWRSKNFHDVCWKNLKDAGFPDRIAWMKAAAKEYPYMDLTRVGIYGGSAGGQNAMRAVIDHADFYKAAAADCGCHDNRMDKVWWNEAWMGWPIDESYGQSSNVVDAHKLGGKLLLTVGMLDRNVDPSSTMQVVAELIKANKDFEFIPFPCGGHGAGESPYGKRRREAFFVKHLIEVANE